MADAQVLRPGEGPPDRARLAAGMHLVNVALHAANALLLFLVLRAMTASTWPSALVAAVFAVHPLHVESVAWITERKDVLSGLFGLLAIGAYAWYARGPSVLRYLSVAAALALGLMAKPMLVTWPFLFLLLDYWPLGRMGRGAGSGEQGPGSGERGRCAEPVPNSDECFRVRTPCEPQFASGSLHVLLPVAGRREDPSAAAGCGVRRRHVSDPAGRGFGRLAGIRADIRTDRPRGSALRRLPWQDPLAGKFGGSVSRRADGELLAGVGGGDIAGAAHRRGLVGGVARAALAGRGLVLVPGHPGADDRPGPGGAGVMADRFLYLPQIGLCVALAWGIMHPGRRLALSSLALRGRRRVVGGGPGGLRLATNVVLAKQRATMDLCLGLHFEQ